MKSGAIVLHALRYNDEQLIVHLLTEQAGAMSMLVRVSHSRRTSVNHALFQPLSILDIEWEERPKADLQRPKAARTAIHFKSLPYDPHKSAIALFLAEFLHYAVRREPESANLYEYVVRSVVWLDTCERGFANFHLVFLLRLTRFLGFMPNVEDYREGSFFDLRASAFTTVQPLHPDYLSPQDAAIVPKLLRMRYGTMHVFKFNGAERSRLLETVNTYYRLHVAGFPELKSLAVLKDLF